MSDSVKTIETVETVDTNNTNNENKEAMTMEDKMAAYEARMAEMQAELLERAFPDITTTTQPFTANQIVKGFKSGKMTSDNTVQRTDVWTNDQRSLFIHSIVTGFPIPQIISVRSEVINKNGRVVLVDDCLDGKQRTRTILMFRSEGFRLGNLAPVVVDDFAYDISGLTYDELPDCIKERFDSRTFHFVRIENADDDTIAEVFKRYNNGTPLSAIEKTRVAAKELATIISIGKHELFESALTKKALARYTNEDIVVKTHMMLNVPMSEICLDNKAVRPYTETVSFDNDDVATINAIYDFALNAYKYLIASGDGESSKKNKRIAKKMLVRTHFISLVPFMYETIMAGKSYEDFAEWVVNFFGSDTEEYRSYASNANSGSNHHAQVANRNRILKASFDKAFVDFRDQQSEGDADDVDAPTENDTNTDAVEEVSDAKVAERKINDAVAARAEDDCEELEDEMEGDVAEFTA